MRAMRCLAIGLVAAMTLAVPGGLRGEDAPSASGSPRAEPPPTPVAAAPATIAPGDAAAHVGEEMSIEGRVHAVHVSPLATVLAFAPNFAGFTASILTADRASFPDDLPTRIHDRRVRVRGTITEYRGRAEMTLRHPSQITVLDAVAPPVRPSATPAAATAAAPTDALAAELRDSLARIEDRLDDLEARLTVIENAAGL